MRSWIWTLILFAAAVALALVLREHGGNVLIVAQPWRIELSLSLAVVLALAAFLALHWLLRALNWLGNSPGRLRAWRGRRAQKRDVELLERGWINVLEGRYVQAEKDLSSLVSRTRSADRKVLAGLSAARALHLLGETARRDQVLRLAQEGAGQDSRLRQAVDTVTAEMYLDQNRAEEALALLEPLQDASSRFLHGTRLLLRAHRQLGHADRVYELTRLLLRRGAIDEAQARQFIRESTAQRLSRVEESGWNALWGDLSADERLDPDVALAGAQAQARLGHPAESARILEAALGRRLDDRLLRVYAHCDAAQAGHRLGHAELWLRSNPDHPGLLAALGQICLASRLWGQGEHYLERSLALRADTHIHALLGNLHDALGHPDQALRNWRLACQAADAEIPAVDRLLPAADTRGDPRFDEMGEAAEAAPDEPPLATSYAASGVYVQDETDVAADPVSAPPPPGPSAGAPAVSAPTEDEYFDTAPIPGVDMSQTSDGGARK
ncbi:HemY protein OS=Castellaniella defragrans OX=75697 GN=HNR28_002318 PE=4 SV=1 [Castellaniella denitrificans]|uniref:heme biosynthesis protein HemY n=1 Tax=Castellaniella sp. TaxID=1955812 RepID=UPI002AFFD380|nr:heme biosynthesis HemY N-terminal domain-containing protein [Castellaniella sp.]